MKSSFPLGCGLCRSEKIGKMDQNNMIVKEVALNPVKYQVKDANAHVRQIWDGRQNNGREWLRYDPEANRR